MTCNLTHCLTTATLAIALSAGLANPAAARSGSAELLKGCEVAVRTELGDGQTRVKRVSSRRSGDVSQYWLNVRHAAASDEATSPYRALCTIDRESAQASVELAPGSWKKARHGRAPVATN